MLSWRRNPATLRMNSTFTKSQRGNGVPRLGQHRHSARFGPGDGGNPVEPAGAAVRRAAAARVPGHWHSGRRVRSRRHQLQRSRHHLPRRLGRAGADPVRRWFENAILQHQGGAGAVDGAGHRRRAAHRSGDRAGCPIRARSELGRSTAGQRRRRLDRRSGGVPTGPCPGAAAAAARRCDPGGRIRHQRSVRGVPHPDAGRADHAR